MAVIWSIAKGPVMHESALFATEKVLIQSTSARRLASLAEERRDVGEVRDFGEARDVSEVQGIYRRSTIKSYSPFR